MGLAHGAILELEHGLHVLFDVKQIAVNAQLGVRTEVRPHQFATVVKWSERGKNTLAEIRCYDATEIGKLPCHDQPEPERELFYSVFDSFEALLPEFILIPVIARSFLRD